MLNLFSFIIFHVFCLQVNMPIDYETEKHRGFAFIEFELPEDAQVKYRTLSNHKKLEGWTFFSGIYLYIEYVCKRNCHKFWSFLLRGPSTTWTIASCLVGRCGWIWPSPWRSRRGAADQSGPATSGYRNMQVEFNVVFFCTGRGSELKKPVPVLIWAH